MLYLLFIKVGSSGDLTSASSQIWGRWYLPTYLFRDGSLTLISMAFSDGPSHDLVFPAHYAEVVQRYFMASDVEVVMYG